MEVSKLTITKDTMNRAGKMTPKERGKLLFARLEEAERDGRLSKAKDRKDVAEIAGYERDAVSGYNWVSTLINRGNISETFRGWGKNGVREAEYHLAKRPNYEHRKSKKKKTPTVLVKPMTAPVTETTAVKAPVETTVKKETPTKEEGSPVVAKINIVKDKRGLFNRNRVDIQLEITGETQAIDTILETIKGV